MTTYTRAQIDAIQPGRTLIAMGIDGRFSEATVVTSIHAKRNDIHGKLFVCGYRQFGEGGQMSFSVKEGEESDFRHTKIVQPEACGGYESKPCAQCNCIWGTV